METYRVKGTSRQVGAIGEHEPFTIYVNADYAKQAYETARDQLYSSNREHVLVKSIEIAYGDAEYDYKTVPAMDYLWM